MIFAGAPRRRRGLELNGHSGPNPATLCNLDRHAPWRVCQAAPTREAQRVDHITQWKIHLMASEIVQFSACGHELTLRVGDDAFRPNTVTQRIAEASEIKPGDEVLDLGCGVGPIGILAAKQGAKPATVLRAQSKPVPSARARPDHRLLRDALGPAA